MTKKAIIEDLSEFDEVIQKQEQGIDVQILGMDGRTPLGFSIRVAGPDSERAQRASDELQQELIDGERLAAPTVADFNLRTLRYLSKITIGWTSFRLDGAELPCTEENAQALYTRFRFIRQQVDAKAGKRAAFLNG